MRSGLGGPSKDVVGAAHLGRGERVLVSCEVPGGWALATTHGLHVVAMESTRPQAARTVRWTDVHTAAATRSAGVLDVRLVDGSAWAVPLGERPGPLAQTVRDRVTNSVLLSRFVPAGGGRGVNVAVRRGPDREPFVQRVADPGVSMTDPEIAADVAQAEAALRDQVGLPAQA